MSDRRVRLWLYIIILSIPIILLIINTYELYNIKHNVKEQIKPIVISIPEDEGKPIIIEEKTEPEPEYLTKLRSIESIEDKKEWYLAYKKLEIEYPELDEIDHIYDVFDNTDIEYLQRAVETECYGADFEGKVNVASVIINRVLNNKYPNTFEKVVTQPNQFAYNKTNISEDTILACEYAWAMRTEIGDCLFFHSTTC